MFKSTGDSAEDKMSNALVFGCGMVIVAVLLLGGIIATVVKVWS